MKLIYPSKLSLSVVVVLAFIICWLPYHIGRNLFAQVDDYETAMLSQNFNMASMVLCYLSASIDPVVYNLMSRKYRAAAKRLFLLHQRPRQTRGGQRQLCVIDHISTLNESLTGVWEESTHNEHSQACLTSLPGGNLQVSLKFRGLGVEKACRGEMLCFFSMVEAGGDRAERSAALQCKNHISYFSMTFCSRTHDDDVLPCRIIIFVNLQSICSLPALVIRPSCRSIYLCIVRCYTFF